MAGVPGSGGPVPKRADRLLGHRAKVDPRAPGRAPAGARARWPAPDPDWHPLARDWYRSLGKSGQAAFYEASDIQMARVGAEVLSGLMSASRMSGQVFASWLSLTTALLATEGDRRRLRLELERVKVVDQVAVDADASVTSLQARLSG